MVCTLEGGESGPPLLSRLREAWKRRPQGQAQRPPFRGSSSRRGQGGRFSVPDGFLGRAVALQVGGCLGQNAVLLHPPGCRGALGGPERSVHTGFQGGRGGSPQPGCCPGTELGSCQTTQGQNVLLGGGCLFHGRFQVEPNRGRVRGVECPHVGAGQVTGTWGRNSAGRHPGLGTTCLLICWWRRTGLGSRGGREKTSA